MCSHAETGNGGTIAQCQLRDGAQVQDYFQGAAIRLHPGGATTSFWWGLRPSSHELGYGRVGRGGQLAPSPQAPLSLSSYVYCVITATCEFVKGEGCGFW